MRRSNPAPSAVNAVLTAAGQRLPAALRSRVMRQPARSVYQAAVEAELARGAAARGAARGLRVVREDDFASAPPFDVGEHLLLTAPDGLSEDVVMYRGGFGDQATVVLNGMQLQVPLTRLRRPPAGRPVVAPADDDALLEAVTAGPLEAEITVDGEGYDVEPGVKRTRIRDWPAVFTLLEEVEKHQPHSGGYAKKYINVRVGPKEHRERIDVDGDGKWRATYNDVRGRFVRVFGPAIASALDREGRDAVEMRHQFAAARTQINMMERHATEAAAVWLTDRGYDGGFEAGPVYYVGAHLQPDDTITPPRYWSARPAPGGVEIFEWPIDQAPPETGRIETRRSLEEHARFWGFPRPERIVAPSLAEFTPPPTLWDMVKAATGAYHTPATPTYTAALRAMLDAMGVFPEKVTARLSGYGRDVVVKLKRPDNMAAVKLMTMGFPERRYRDEPQTVFETDARNVVVPQEAQPAVEAKLRALTANAEERAQAEEAKLAAVAAAAEAKVEAARRRGPGSGNVAAAPFYVDRVQDLPSATYDVKGRDQATPGDIVAWADSDGRVSFYEVPVGFHAARWRSSALTSIGDVSTLHRTRTMTAELSDEVRAYTTAPLLTSGKISDYGFNLVASYFEHVGAWPPGTVRGFHYLVGRNYVGKQNDGMPRNMRVTLDTEVKRRDRKGRQV